MPARLSSMELSDPITPDASPNGNATNRRKSTRMRQKPVLLQEDVSTSRSTNGSNKRKRTSLRGGEPTSMIDETSDEESSPEESDGHPDEEELKEKRKRAAKQKKVSTRPAVKKPKVGNATITTLAVRPALNGAPKTTKSKRPRARSNTFVSDADTGLYCRSGKD